MSGNPAVGRARLAGRAVMRLTLVLTAAVCLALPAQAAAGTLDQQQTVINNSAFLWGNGAGVAFSAAQTFTAGLTGGLDQVDLALAHSRDGNSVGVTVEIWTVSGTGAPGVKLGQSVTIPPNAIGGFGFASALFSPPIPVTAGVQYAIVAYTGGADQYQWGTASPNPYGGGQLFQVAASPPTTFSANPDFDATFRTYVEADADGDGVSDAEDNCPGISNADQADLDSDNVGDVCDADDDGDGVADAGDNCPTVANADQVNTDGGLSGDACDSDDDNDGVGDAGDNCRVVVNAGQEDLDGDGAGDACDGDDDNDGVADAGDNCPTANPDQADLDADGAGDACDGDDDGDGAADTADNCATAANGDQRDIDGDAAGDVCDADDDNDRLTDVAELALGTSSADLDSDDDGLADAREDRNHDGKKGRRETNPARFDTDRDGLSDGLERGLRHGVKNPLGPVKGTGRRFKRDRDPRSKTNPLKRDTDNGGVPDGREDKNRNGRVDKGETNPTKPGNG